MLTTMEEVEDVVDRVPLSNIAKKMIGNHPIVFATAPYTNTRRRSNNARSHEKYTTVVQGLALCMGVMKDKKTFVQEWMTHNQVKCVVNYSFHRISLYFTAHQQEYKAEFSFSDLMNRQVLADYLPGDNNEQQQQQSGRNHNNKKKRKGEHGNKQSHVPNENARALFFTFHLKYPPKYWRLTEQGPTNQENRWARVTNIPLATRRESKMAGGSCEPVRAGQPDNKCMQLGSWIVLRMSFSNRAATRKKYDEVLDRGKKYRLVRQLYPRQFLRPVTRAELSEYHPTYLHKQDESDVDLTAEFVKFYALHCYISRYLLNELDLDSLFYNEYAKISPDKADEAIRYILANLANGHGGRKTPGQHLKMVCEKYISPVSPTVSKKKGKKRLQRMIHVNKASITPTTIRIEPVQRETANRVLRHFSNHQDRFLRVQFIDENGKLIRTPSKPYHENNELYFRINRVFKEGIHIHDRHYTFLAFSSSQLREHGCWFFANTNHLTADQIRSWMGDFSKERAVAKYAARMGQCFSSTQASTKISSKNIQWIQDIMSDDKLYTFSDGVGWISRKLANTIVGASYYGKRQQSRALTMITRPFIISAFQIRLGGAKGVLTVVPKKKFDKNKKVALRPSQIKFQSKHKMLEVIRMSHASTTSLNRQIILLLSSLGVPDHVFLTLLDMMLKALDKILTDPIQCAQMLRSNADEFGMHDQMARLVESGFLESNDPFVCNLVKMFRVSKLNEAKRRARIPVHEAVSALGVLDETNTLKEGQIFCQLSDRKNKIIQGPCILYRCPSLHPGDIRMVEAVDCPELRDLYDVIVFSQQGERDLPSMCSGGDLDGDIYSIIWDEELFPSKQDTLPMHHQTIKPPEKDGLVTIDDIRNFFVDYIANDNLGLIANAHMAIADQSAKYACEEKCIKLAYLHSVAVDFPKTGVPAVLRDDQRPKKYPDFMEKTDKQEYESPRILGQLFRAIDANEIQNYKKSLELKTIYDTRMHVDGMERYIWAARELKETYDQEVRELMNQYGVATESELVSGSIVKWLKKEDGPDKFHEVRHEARREITRLRDHWRRAHFPTLNGGGKRRKRKNKKGNGYQEYTREEKRQDDCKAAAWYYVTYHPTEHGREEKRMLSFPWVAQEILCRLAKVNKHSERYTRAIPELEIMSFCGDNNRSSGSATNTTPAPSSLDSNTLNDEATSSSYLCFSSTVTSTSQSEDGSDMISIESA